MTKLTRRQLLKYSVGAIGGIVGIVIGTGVYDIIRKESTDLTTERIKTYKMFRDNFDIEAKYNRASKELLTLKESEMFLDLTILDTKLTTEICNNPELLIALEKSNCLEPVKKGIIYQEFDKLLYHIERKDYENQIKKLNSLEKLLEIANKDNRSYKKLTSDILDYIRRDKELIESIHKNLTKA